jgi:hypothetical protein
MGTYLHLHWRRTALLGAVALSLAVAAFEVVTHWRQIVAALLLFGLGRALWRRYFPSRAPRRPRTTIPQWIEAVSLAYIAAQFRAALSQPPARQSCEAKTDLARVLPG